jgi:hypothetical protein
MKYSPMKGKKDPWVCLIPHKNFNPLNPEEDTAGTFNMKDMGHLTKEAENLVLMQERLQDLIVQSNELAQKIRLAEEESLPALMDKIGLKEIKLTDGNTLKIVPFVRASIPSMSFIAKLKDVETRMRASLKREDAIHYLETHGAAALIKNQVIADLGKDGGKLQLKVLAALKKLKVEAKAFRDIHPQTLTAWVKEKLESGTPLEHEVLSISTGEIARLEGFKSKPSSKEGSKTAGPQLF